MVTASQSSRATGKETRRPSIPRKAPYQARPQATTSGDREGGSFDSPSPAHSSEESYSSRSSPPRVSPGSSPGHDHAGQSPTTGTPPRKPALDPKSFKLVKHGIVAHSFGRKLARAFFGEVFSMNVNHKDGTTAAYRKTDTAYYRFIDHAFVKHPSWPVDDIAEIKPVVVDYSIDVSCGRIIKYNSAGASWKPPQWFAQKYKPGLHWFQGPMGGAGIKLALCENTELAYHHLSIPDGQRLKCVLSRFQTCNLRIKWKGFPDVTFEIRSMHPSYTREMYLHELAMVVGSQVLRYFAEVANTVPGLDPVNDVIVLGLINLDENEWTVMLQHCEGGLRRVPPPGWQGVPPPVWAVQTLQPQGWDADTASIASGLSSSGLSSTATLVDVADAGKKHEYAGSVARASPGYAPSCAGASPQSQYFERDDASTISGKYNYSLQSW